MEISYSTRPVAPAANQIALRNRLLIPMVCMPFLAGVLFFGNRTSQASLQPKAVASDALLLQEDDETPPVVGDFSVQGPLPDGTVTLQDVTFDAPEAFPFMGRSLNIKLRYTTEGTVTLSHENDVLWQGAVADASFAEETIAAVHTIKKDPVGSEPALWSNAGELATPDLQFLVAEGGSARLLGKNGIVLWSGQLNSSSLGGSSRSRGHTLEINAGGVQIDGTNGAFTVKNAKTGSLLWSGTLPREPVILVRSKNEFTFSSPNRAEGGSDHIDRVHCKTEAGTVTIADKNGTVIGSRPITILKTYETRETTGSAYKQTVPTLRRTTPNPALTTTGAIFLTYTDSKGRVIRRVKVYKDSRQSGRIG